MKIINVRVPVRADLAGGTLDLWPLYLFHPGSRTVNVAISFHAECELSERSGHQIELHLTDQSYERTYDSIAEVLDDPNAILIGRALEHFQLTGVKITTRTDAPRGSGLGGSSALAVALVRGLSELAGNKVEGEDLIALVRDIETRLIQSPAGVQDYYPPVFGGLASLHLNPGRITRRPLAMATTELARHFVLHYSGVAHFSGTNNWEIYKRHIDGDKKIRSGLEKISHTAIEMENALEAGDVKKAGELLNQEWKHRKALVKGVSNPEIEQAVAAGLAAGAWGAKVCGAGGGGCIIFLAPSERRKELVEALKQVPGKTLDAAPVSYGITVDRQGDPQSSFSFASRRARARGTDEVPEQLYLVETSERIYRPYILVEGTVRFDEPRSGIHATQVRCLMAPVDLQSECIDWQRSIEIDPERLSLTADANPRRQTAVAPASEALRNASEEGKESFRHHLAESARLSLLHNPSFGLYSQLNETRESFVQRCLAEAQTSLAAEAERLESTYRRRIDQIRERQQKEERVLQEENPLPDGAVDVNIAWGQTLYNITSGKPVASPVAPQSMRENDYMGRVAELQKMWDREREGRIEELTAKAREIEPIVVTAPARNVEIQKYLIVWAGGSLPRKGNV